MSYHLLRLVETFPITRRSTFHTNQGKVTTFIVQEKLKIEVLVKSFQFYSDTNTRSKLLSANISTFRKNLLLSLQYG